MQKFYFHIRGHHLRLEDPDGAEFPDLAAAHSEAIATIREILAEKLRCGDVIDGQKLEICDDKGTVFETIPFRSVLAEPE